jgi:dTDP-4-amino-4,6-dideoxygalactose transaminase
MSPWSVPLADVQVLEEDIARVADTYRSGWLSMGPETEGFERELEAYTSSPHALAVANGTDALHLITTAAGLGPGDAVIVPSLTFVATVNAVAYTGARPVFADVGSVDQPWLTRASVEAAIAPEVRAIFAMTYGGHPGELLALRDLAAERGLLLFEDAAHGLGGSTAGEHLGTVGVAGAYSFFSNKNLAIGEGGAVVTGDEQLAARMRLLRSHGMTTLTWDRHRGHASGYDVVALGFNHRIDEPRATLARARLARLDAENARRAELAARYRAAFGGVDRMQPTAPAGRDDHPAHHLFTVVLDEQIDRDRFRELLAADGVQTSVHYPPVHRFSIYEQPGVALPVTESYARRAVTLPLFASMSDEQHELVVTAVGDALATLSIPSTGNAGVARQHRA